MQLRKIPITMDFMGNKKIYDRIWGYLQINSYLGEDQENQQHRFIYKDFESMLELYNRINTKIYDYTKNCEKNFFSYNTFTNSFKILQELGYIMPGMIIDNRKRLVEVYYLSENFTPYKLVPLETLKFLLDTKKNNIIKVYASLLSWYDYKKGYRFTLEELSATIGYTSKAKNTELREMLYFLKRNGLIQFSHTKTTTSNGITTYYYILNKVDTIATIEESHQELLNGNDGEFYF